jgi:hypothetical protein
MNVKIGTEAAQFREKEYINGIFLTVRGRRVAAWTNLNEVTSALTAMAVLMDPGRQRK